MVSLGCERLASFELELVAGVALEVVAVVGSSRQRWQDLGEPSDVFS